MTESCQQYPFISRIGTLLPVAFSAATEFCLPIQKQPRLAQRGRAGGLLCRRSKLLSAGPLCAIQSEIRVKLFAPQADEPT